MNDTFKDTLKKFDESADNLDLLVKQVVVNCTKELDEYIGQIDSIMCGDDDILDEDLNNWVMNIPLLLYGTITLSEKIITSEYLAKLVEKEKLNEHKAKADGTVAAKQAQAEEATRDEALIKALYVLASKRVSDRIDTAKELLNSVKKVISRRMTELEISNNKFN